MQDFNDILRRSLSIVTDGYEKARGDINDVVGLIRGAIKENIGDNFSLELAEAKTDIKGSTFNIYLDTDIYDLSASIVPVVDIRIPGGGYPVELGDFNKSLQVFHSRDEVLCSRIDVEQFFAQQLSDPDSSLIQSIGFALRQKANKR